MINTHTPQTMDQFLNNHIQFRFENEEQRNKQIKFWHSVVKHYQNQITKCEEQGSTVEDSGMLRESIDKYNKSRQALSTIFYRTSVK